jgi:anti-anti-sigma factor
MRQHVIAETTVVVQEDLEGSAADPWRRLIADAAALQPARLVVDLRQARNMDAATLVFLLQVHRQMVRADGQLVLRSPSERVLHLLDVTRADQVLDIQETGRPVTIAGTW